MTNPLLNWLPFFPTFLVGLCVSFLPGALVSWILGARGIRLLGLSVMMSYAIIALGSIVFWLLGIPWNLIALALLSFFLAGLTWVLMRLFGNNLRITPQSSEKISWGYIGVALAMLSIAISFILAIPDPNSLSQTYDANFHLNAVQHILQTGSASPFTLLQVSNIQDTLIFQQSEWHAFTALLVPFAGSVFEATNVSALVIASFVWPVAAIFLSNALLGTSQKVTLFAGILAAAFPSFPLLLIEWGVLYPNLLGLALLPFSLAFVVILFKLTPEYSYPKVTLWVFAVTSIFAIGSAHPNAVYTLVALAAVIALFPIARRWKSLAGNKPAKTLLVVTTFVSYLLAGLFWVTGLHSSTWGPYANLGESIFQWIFNSAPNRFPAILIGILILVGGYSVIKTRNQRWILAPLGLLFLIHLAVSVFPPSVFRSALVGIWHGDAQRVAAMMPLLMLPLAVAGVKYLLERPQFNRGGFEKYGVIGLAFVACIATQGLAMQESKERLAEVFEVREDSYVLSIQELQVFEYVKENLDSSVVLIGDPWTGAGLIYAYSGNKTLFTHVKGSFGEDAYLLREELKNGGVEVCSAVMRSGVEYVLDFAGEYIENEPKDLYDGLRDLHEYPTMFSPVFNSGNATLYRIIFCD